jgi:alkanesulfonate monooxygenase SsuD/methylene tetrahydromethanopterin reductase-like flavin-dependent oxidoreductase (luciferase family)
MSDGELFGKEDMGERYRIAMESLDIILELWSRDAPFRIDGEHWKVSLENQVWLNHGVGRMTRPLQQPHPPIAMAMVGPGGPTAELIAARDFIPISSNFVPLENIEAQWRTYAETRDRLGLPADPSVWRVCRNILITESNAQAEEILADPDGVFSYYYRYLRGVRQIESFRDRQDAPSRELNTLLEVDQALEDCVIAGSFDVVLERLMGVVDRLGPMGTLVMVGHDWDDTDLWQESMRRLSQEAMPRLSQHSDRLQA